MSGGIQLWPHQLEALAKMKNGCILNGDVGSGKSITSLSYYYIKQGGEVNTGKHVHMRNKPKDLIIITTARKRDELDWEKEIQRFKMTTYEEFSIYNHRVIVDSWNNIKKYVDFKDTFFIFDEQRVIGYGAWTKSFLKITKKNEWILLSATPGDTWSDYIPVFIANGWYKNKTEFERMHAVYSRWANFPKIERWINEGRLETLRRRVLIDMPFERHTVRHNEYIYVGYNRELYNKVQRDRWNIYTDEPIVNAAEFCFTLRKVVNSDISRVLEVKKILEKHPKAIIFYSYNYELFLLRKLLSREYRVAEKNAETPESQELPADTDLYLIDWNYLMAEWNGHKHEPIPESEGWAYLVEYISGSEGWNCILTDTIIFYSQNYSYRIMHQASGRIDRLNTSYTDLYYYHLRSNAQIDIAVTRALKNKKKFNERGFAPKFTEKE